MSVPRWIPYIAIVAAGWIVWLGVTRGHKPEPVVVLPDSALQRDRPKPTLTLPQHITTRTVKPTQVATSEGKPDTARVRVYCAPADPPRADTASGPSHEAAAPAPPRFPPFAGRAGKHTLELHATLGDGTLWRGRYTIGSRAEWATTDTSVVVHTPRRLLGLIEMDPGLFVDGEWYPVSRGFAGRAGVSLGDDRQVRAGVNEHADPFVGFHAEF